MGDSSIRSCVYAFTGEMLVRARLFHLPELDAQLVRMMTANRSSLPADLAIHLIRTCLVSDPVVTSADLFNTLNTLAKIARHSSNGSSVLMLVEQARQVTRSDQHCFIVCVLTPRCCAPPGRMYITAVGPVL